MARSRVEATSHPTHLIVELLRVPRSSHFVSFLFICLLVAICSHVERSQAYQCSHLSALHFTDLVRCQWAWRRRWPVVVDGRCSLTLKPAASLGLRRRHAGGMMKSRTESNSTRDAPASLFFFLALECMLIVRGCQLLRPPAGLTIR